MNLVRSRPALVRSGRSWLVLVLLLLFVGLGIKYESKARQHRSAILRWQPQIQAMDEGVDISRRYNYPNPPIMAVLLDPLTWLPPRAAALAWFSLKVALTFLAFAWVFRLVEDPHRPFPAWAQALTVLLSLRPVMSDLDHGNVNLFILFLVVAALTAYRLRRDLLAGVLLALAISCKVTPALFVPYLMWKRAWRALAGVVLGLVLFLWPGLVPGLRLGFAANQQQLASWYQDMVHPFLIDGKVTSEHNNQSLPGVVARLCTHSPSFSTYVNQQYTPTHYHNLLALSSAQSRWLVKGCMTLFALLLAWACRTPTQIRQGWRLAAEFSLVVLGMLLFSERTWKSHCVTLILPFAVLCYYLAVCRPGPALRAYLIGSLLTVALLMALTSSGLTEDEAARQTHLTALFAKQAQVYGAWMWAHLILVAALVTLLRSRPAPALPREKTESLPAPAPVPS